MQQAQAAEASEDLLVLTTDGKGMVMRPEDLREATRKAAARAGPKRTTRLRPGEKRPRKRMATVASVSTVAPYARGPEAVMSPAADELPRPKAHNKRVWASVEREAEAVIDDLFAEALRRDPTQQRAWVVLVDGEPHQLARMQAAAARYRVSVTMVMDFMHVLAYLWDAARSLSPGDSHTSEMWVQERAQKVLQGHAREVAAGMRRSATWRGVSDKQRELDGFSGHRRSFPHTLQSCRITHPCEGQRHSPVSRDPRTNGKGEDALRRHSRGKTSTTSRAQHPCSGSTKVGYAPISPHVRAAVQSCFSGDTSTTWQDAC